MAASTLTGIRAAARENPGVTRTAIVAALGLGAYLTALDISIGAAMVFTNVAAIMTRVFPAEQRGKALGIQAMIVYVGLATGAPLGGWLTSAFGWQSVFFLNVPLGLLALVLG